MIHENGKLQVIDFGIAGFVESKLDKRSTVIGTPHWMAPELLKAAGGDGPSYSTEVSSAVFVPEYLSPYLSDSVNICRLMYGRMA